MTSLNGFYPDCDGLRSEAVESLDQRRYVLDGADFPICGAELLDAYDHDRALTLLLVALRPGQRGIYSTEDDLVVERVW
jgi:hypothetical protein